MGSKESGYRIVVNLWRIQRRSQPLVNGKACKSAPTRGVESFEFKEDY